MLVVIDIIKISYLYYQLGKTILHYKPTNTTHTDIQNTLLHSFIHKTRSTQNRHITQAHIHTHKHLQLRMKRYYFNIIFDDE